MGSQSPQFNHVGIGVTDLERSRAFYERALGFKYWFELNDIPDESSAQLLQLEPPLGLRATYLVLGGLVLELLVYRPDRVAPWRPRSMAEPGLTHISISVDDFDSALALVEQHGGTVLGDTRLESGVMIRDPDGQLIELLLPRFREFRPPPPV